MTEEIKIPVDIYESEDEIVIVLPLAGVPKDTIKIWLEKTTLYVSWDRKQPQLKETLKPVISECFRWSFVRKIELPQNIYFDKITSVLTPENVLIIVVPKIIIPEKLEIRLN